MLWKINLVFSAVFSLVTICSANLLVNITVNNHKDIEIKTFGDVNKIITEKDIRLFGLSDDKLKMGVRVELGRVPEGVFLRKPTPYGDLYAKFKWQEVKRNLRIKSAKVLEILEENIILKRNVFINNATESMKTQRNIYQRVENTAYSLWSAKGLPMDNFFYNISINFDNGILKYENKWRDSTIRNIYLPFGVSENGEVVIQPGKEIIIQLSAIKMIAVIEIIYEAQLMGHLIANFARVYGNYHFYAPNIRSVMESGGLKNQIETREVIEIRCYTDPVMKIFDKSTGRLLNFIDPAKRVYIRKALKHNI